ncbi:MAG TPA: DUF6051 family protein, partial [Bacteroidota bacterium]
MLRHPRYLDIGRRFRHKENWHDAEPLFFAQEGADLYNLSFVSKNAHFLTGCPSYSCPEHGLTFPGEPTVQQPADADVVENIRFRYPLVREHGTRGSLRPHRHCVILLHGLNEHSFTKYLPWAYTLWSQTGWPVILFPLTFHINRVLPQWARHQEQSFTLRQRLAENENVHRFNAVISERLAIHPERFFWGALQSYHDLVDLVHAIRKGAHPHIAPDARIDLLGFSAGGYIALVLLLEDAGGLFANSRGVLFATCAAVRNINLSSPLIVDLMAEVALMKLYVKHREKLSSQRMSHWFHEHPEGRWLDAFCGLMPDHARLEARLRALGPRLLGIANTNDQVMPAAEMLNMLAGIRRDTGVRVEELPLGIHENPFAIADYHQRDRAIVMETLDEERFGKEFQQFMENII